MALNVREAEMLPEGAERRRVQYSDVFGFELVEVVPELPAVESLAEVVFADEQLPEPHRSWAAAYRARLPGKTYQPGVPGDPLDI